MYGNQSKCQIHTSKYDSETLNIVIVNTVNTMISKVAGFIGAFTCSPVQKFMSRLLTDINLLLLSRSEVWSPSLLESRGWVVR